MPICTWCGIDSKNDVVCDWCKRPLSLRSSRFGASAATGGSGRSGVDLLAEDDDSGTVLPKVIAAGAIVFVCALIAIFFGIANMNKQPEAPVATATPPSAPVKEVFTEGRLAQAGPVQTSYVPPPRVFLPPSAGLAPDTFRTGTLAPLASSSPNFRKLKLEDENDVKFGISGAKLINAKKPNGDLVCYGTVKIFNSSIDNIVDFQIYLVSGKRKFVVKPFTGSLDDMEPLQNHVVHAKEALTMPIVVDQYKGSAGTVSGKLVVVATLDSTPKPQYFESDLGSGSKSSGQKKARGR